MTEDVANNVAQGNSQDLTEQWKNGELKRSWYYVLLFSNEEYITFIDGNWVVDDRLIGDDIKEVLAPVPSYEEVKEFEKEHNLLGELCERLLCIEEKQWENIVKTKSKKQQIEFLSDKTKFSFLALFDENQKLKELLKECRELFDELNYLNMVEKIDNAIGE